MEPKKRGLGRGLNALFEDEEATFGESVTPEAPAKAVGRTTLGIDQLAPSAFQPRTVFDDTSIAELAESIKNHGMLQPILVRKVEEVEGLYQIIAGERRWHAAQKAQLHEVPVIIREFTDTQAFEIALVENLQREDLNALDEAMGYQKLMDRYGYTQEQLAKSLGKSRSYIANIVRLGSLPIVVQAYLESGELSVGHARALITAEEPEALAKQIIADGLSVRQTEQLVAETTGRQKDGRAGAVKSSSASAKAKKDVDTLALEQDLSNTLGMRVAIDSRDGVSGRVTIDFKTLDQLDDIIRRLGGR